MVPNLLVTQRKLNIQKYNVIVLKIYTIKKFV